MYLHSQNDPSFARALGDHVEKHESVVMLQSDDPTQDDFMRKVSGCPYVEMIRLPVPGGESPGGAPRPCPALERFPPCLPRR